MMRIFTAVVVILSLHGTTLAQSPRIPPDAHGYQRYLLRNEAAQPVRSVSTSTRPRTYSSDLPPYVPLNRTYTWYSAPAEFRVVMQTSLATPRFVTVVQPDGTKRTFQIEGPVLVRRPLVVRR